MFNEFGLNQTRRYFFKQGSQAIGWAALASLMAKDGRLLGADSAKPENSKLVGKQHFPGKVKHVIHLHMVGGPSQMDLYDYKPVMDEWFDKDLPDSVRMGQRLTTMTSGQKRFPIAPSKYKFAQQGQCGMWVTELLPQTSKMVDEMCFIRSMHTEAINHEPAMSYIMTGNQLNGRPALGSWMSYGLGSLNDDLPTFVVMVAKPTNMEQLQAISQRCWNSGYLSGEHTGVAFRTVGDPVLYVNNPPGVPAAIRRKTIDAMKAMNELQHKDIGDPETLSRIQQYELAFRMQTSVPELADLSKEPESTFALYGEEAKKPGTFANSALNARRLVEKGVRFVQVFLNNWDHHGNLGGRMPAQCKDIDQACYGLVQDLKQRGLLDSTLIIWGGEFGRTIYSQGGVTKQNYGRDHHPRCFTMWMAGGGFKGGTIYGETDDFSYNIVKDPVHIRDFHATILHQMGFEHERFNVKFQGLDARLTGVDPAKVIKELLA